MVEFYRDRLVELYETHNPANVARVEYLLKKYRGQEAFLYRSVCAKYNKPPETPPAAGIATQALARPAAAAPPPVAASLATTGGAPAKAGSTRPKAALPRPPPAVRAVLGESGGVEAGAAKASRPTAARGQQLEKLARIDFLLLGERSGFFDKAVVAGASSGESTGSGSSMSASGEYSSSDEEEEEEAPQQSAAPRGRARAAGRPGDRAATAPTGGDGEAQAAACEEDEDEMSDDNLAEALAAKLQANTGATASTAAVAEQGAAGKATEVESSSGEGAPPVHGERRRERQGEGGGREGSRGRARGGRDVGRDGGREAGADGRRGQRGDDEGNPTAKSKAAPRDGRKAVASAEGHEGAAAKEEDEEEDLVSLFDQWLACLKFLVGWNEAATQDADAVRAALKEHLREEGIEGDKTAEQISATVVPLLLDVRRIDGAVVKNVKAQVVKGLKTVQVSILRIVAFELCRERDAKAELKKRGAKSKARVNGKLELGPGATHLASDISSLAKVVAHFRFDKTFSHGLHQLITSIRTAGRTGTGSGKPAGSDSKGKRKESVATEALAKSRRVMAASKSADR